MSIQEHDSSPVWGMYVEWRNRAEKAEAIVAALACWAVWEKNGQLGLYHAVDGDAPTREEWLKIGEILKRA